MNEFLVAGLSLVGGTLAGVGTALVTAKSEEKKAAREQSGQTERAEIQSESDVNKILFARLDTLEKRQSDQDELIADLLVVVERARANHEWTRKLMLRWADQFRDVLDEHTIADMKSVVAFDDLLLGLPALRRLQRKIEARAVAGERPLT